MIGDGTQVVTGSVQAVQVTAKLGGTQGKKAAKTVKKTVKQNIGKAKSTAKQAKNKAVTKSGASNWYGPDRPKFLGMLFNGLADCYITAHHCSSSGCALGHHR